jgi:hypothetical protein
MAVYSTTWFLALLGLLFLNILNATISRIPYKKHHIGFVITHIGLLTLLTGSMVTSLQGIDGQLSIVQGQSNSWVILPRLMLSYQYQDEATPTSIVFDKSLKNKDIGDLDFLNKTFGHLFVADKILPFVKMEKSYTMDSSNPNDAALSFIMRNQFFNFSEWLHNTENPEMQMGPAVVRIVVDKPNKKDLAPKKSIPKLAKKKEVPTTDALIITEANTKKILKEIQISQLMNKAVKIGENLIHFKGKFRRGIVAQNKLIEAEEPGEPNPVLEIEVETKGTGKPEKIREVLYSKFPGFSLHKEGIGGLLFEFRSNLAGASDNSEVDSNASADMSTTAASVATGARQKNTIEFHLNPQNRTSVRVELYKENKLVGSEVLAEGQNYQTPWMGIKIFIGSLIWGKNSVQTPGPAELQRGMPLPPSAIYLRPAGSTGPDDGMWLLEGESKQVTLNNRPAEVYFGREAMQLPFSVHLDRFSKTDYPGTETPMSYESDVKIDGRANQLISMNEPLRERGYTLYQASFIMNPGSPPETILSVNRDPGRSIKYWGSLIMSIGIIVLTVMRSKWYLQRNRGGKI